MNMNKSKCLVTNIWFIPLLLLAICPPASSSEIETLATGSIELLIPGTTRNLTVTQENDFPLGVNQMLIFVTGYGGVSITLSKQDTEGDLLVLSGVALSSARVIPFIRFGRTRVNLNAAIEIGSEGFPFGLIWLSSWISPPLPEAPGNNYNVTLVGNLTF
jgi:hypothetical protein